MPMKKKKPHVRKQQRDVFVPALAPFRATQLCEALPKGLPDIYLTFVTPQTGSVSTFADDNYGSFKFWWLSDCARQYRPNYQTSLTMRQITDEIDPVSGDPIHLVSSCLFVGGRGYPLTGEQTRECHSSDAETGEPLIPPSGDRFVDFVLPAIIKEAA